MRTSLSESSIATKVPLGWRQTTSRRSPRMGICSAAPWLRRNPSYSPANGSASRLANLWSASSSMGWPKRSSAAAFAYLTAPPSSTRTIASGRFSSRVEGGTAPLVVPAEMAGELTSEYRRASRLALDSRRLVQEWCSHTDLTLGPPGEGRGGGGLRRCHRGPACPPQAQHSRLRHCGRPRRWTALARRPRPRTRLRDAGHVRAPDVDVHVGSRAALRRPRGAPAAVCGSATRSAPTRAPGRRRAAERAPAEGARGTRQAQRRSTAFSPGCTGAGSSSPTARSPGSSPATPSTSRARRGRCPPSTTSAASIYVAVPTAPPWWASEEGYTDAKVRRIMAGGRRGGVGPGLAGALRHPRRQPVGGDALAALRDLADGRAAAGGDGAGRRRRSGWAYAGRWASRSSTWASTT